MNRKIIILFSLILVASFFGGKWEVVNAQGTIPDVIPIPVTGGSIIAAGLGHTCVTTADGRVLCWGLNDSGQVGDSSLINRLKPVFVKDMNGVFNISLGSKHSCVLKNDGTVWCWGLNSSGQLGNGLSDNSSVPVLVLGLPDVTNSITSGENFTCAVLADSSIWCWGENKNGQLNDGTLINQPKPVKSLFSALPAQISGGQTEVVAEASGQVSLWDKKLPKNIFGLNDAFNISGNRFAPGGCSANGAGIVNCWAADKKPKAVNDITNALMVEAGLDHGCALDTNNMVVCWGNNENGELGDGKTEDHENAAPVANLESVAALAVGGHHSCVLVGDGEVMCWGSNPYGQLGNNTTVNSNVPVQVIFPAE